MYGTEIDQLKNEWRCGVLLNPFKLIDDDVREIYCYNEHWSNDILREKSSDVCSGMAEIFLECTAYRVTENEIMRAGEEAFLTAMFHYLYCEAPVMEHNLSMICQLVRAEISTDYSSDTDLQRLFNMLAENDEKHEANKHFEVYLTNPAGRRKIVKSLIRRLSPLFSFHTDDNLNIFENCGASEIFDMGVALLHNLSLTLAEPYELARYKEEIAFVVAALNLMHNAYPAREQSAKTFFKLLNNPVLLDEQIKEHPNAFEAKRYWSICREDMLEGTYFEEKVGRIEDFYKEYV